MVNKYFTNMKNTRQGWLSLSNTPLAPAGPERILGYFWPFQSLEQNIKNCTVKNCFKPYRKIISSIRTVHPRQVQIFMFPIRNLLNNLRFSNSYPQSAIKGVLIKDQDPWADFHSVPMVPSKILQILTCATSTHDEAPQVVP